MPKNVVFLGFSDFFVVSRTNVTEIQRHSPNQKTYLNYKKSLENSFPAFNLSKYLNDFQFNCPDGCPCDRYPCTEKTTAPYGTIPTVKATTAPLATNAVLVLNTWNAANKQMVIGWDGEFILGYKK